MKLKGLYTAMITPFNSQGQVDQEGLRQNLRYQLRHHVQGVVVLGTTGEAPTLNPAEKQRIIEIAVEEVKGKITLLVGTGGYSTEQTITATRQAQELGADGALIITPYYNKPTQEGLYRHFAAICEAVSFPICIYNNQPRTGQNLQTDTLKRLMHFPSIRGVKDASGNIMQFNDVLEMTQQEYPYFGVVSGDDVLTLPLMALGGHGLISIISNLIPGPVQNMITACLAGDYVLARQWHYPLLPFFKAAFLETNPIPIKAAMQLCGMASGACRLPLCDLAPPHFQQLKHLIHTLPSAWFPYGSA